MRFTPESVDYLAQSIMNRRLGGSRNAWNRRFASHFCVSQDVTCELWVLLEEGELPGGFRPSHLLWTLLFLTLYDSESVLAGMCGCHEDTFRKWIWVGIDRLANLHLVRSRQQMLAGSLPASHLLSFLFDSRLIGMTGTWMIMGVSAWSQSMGLTVQSLSLHLGIQFGTLRSSMDLEFAMR